MRFPDTFIPAGEVLPRRNLIANLHEAVKALPQTHIELTHHFADRCYGREGVIPKGSVVIGRVHKQSQIQVVLSGRFCMFTDTGGLTVISAPAVYISPAGLVRSMYYLEDTRLVTILGTDETDPDIIFDTLTSESYEAFLEAQKFEGGNHVP